MAETKAKLGKSGRRKRRIRATGEGAVTSGYALSPGIPSRDKSGLGQRLHRRTIRTYSGGTIPVGKLLDRVRDAAKESQRRGELVSLAVRIGPEGISSVAPTDRRTARNAGAT